ncbi:MAG: RNA methyltransferase [Oscillospiraceae bacterium]|jgi:TrmH family RNA methyltransferase|nr:RNA methyltransferase [Oscillospiraceae bacterium]
MPEYITSKKNPLIAHVIKLFSSRKYRREHGMFIAEGSKLLLDAVSSGSDISAVILSDGGAESFDTSVLPGGVRIVSLPDGLFEYISSQESSQGVIFTAALPERREVTLKGGILLDGLQDPGNVGTIIRTAAAAGMAGVILHGGCADPFGYKAVRASMGAVFRVPVMECGTEEIIAALGGGTALYAAAADGETDIRNVEWDKVTPVIGNEGNGISAALLRLCGGSYAIPMRNGTESLNAAQAAAITMWEAKRGSL